VNARAQISADPRIGLIDRWQRDFPLCPRPYVRIGECADLTEREVIATLRELSEEGLLARVGVTVTPNTAGVSTLAAMAVPAARLEEVAAAVNAEWGVNHNYERGHALNLWFVVAAPDREALDATLMRINARTGIDIVDLPMERAYHIDLGFSLTGNGDKRRDCAIRPAEWTPDDDARRLLAAIEDGLPLSCRPFAAIGRRLDWSEADVLTRLGRLIEAGIVSRLGCIVRHRALGFTANAMVAWDVADDRVDGIGALVARHADVTLCYRRTRRLPVWPYNLFAMIHGRERAGVERRIRDISAAAGLSDAEPAILFSGRCFKQRGARYSAKPAGPVA
jgi:DNA-binding Lrp family transcriptional regulator